MLSGEHEMNCEVQPPPTRFGNSRPQVWVFMKQLYDKESSLCDTPWCSGLKNSKLWTVIGFLWCFCSPVIWAVRREKVKALINAWRLILNLVFSIKSLNGGNLFKIWPYRLRCRKNTHSGPNVQYTEKQRLCWFMKQVLKDGTTFSWS